MLHWQKKLRNGLELHIYNLGKQELPSHLLTVEESKKWVAKYTNIPPQEQYILQQVHGKTIWQDTECKGVLEGDGLFTQNTGQALIIKTADCMPVFLYSESQPLLFALHAGWRGTQAKICEKAIQLSQQLFPGENVDLQGYIGPCIRKNNYEVQWDVAQHFASYPNSCLEKKATGYFLGLDAILQHDLVEIDFINSGTCTLDSPDYFSHRGGDKGRNLGVAFLQQT
ncbi:MAG: polyphenol oxidase family protein [Spirochaetota bacterium]